MHVLIIFAKQSLNIILQNEIKINTFLGERRELHNWNKNKYSLGNKGQVGPLRQHGTKILWK
jgi:hypothetical protein